MMRKVKLDHLNENLAIQIGKLNQCPRAEKTSKKQRSLHAQSLDSQPRTD